MYLMLTVRDILLHRQLSLESISAGPPGLGGGDLDLQTRTRLTSYDGPRRAESFLFSNSIPEHLQNSVAYTCLMRPFTFHSPTPLP